MAKILKPNDIALGKLVFPTLKIISSTGTCIFFKTDVANDSVNNFRILHFFSKRILTKEIN